MKRDGLRAAQSGVEGYSTLAGDENGGVSRDA